MSNLIKKFKSIVRRLRLGDRFKHQYNCHPAFELRRTEQHCEVFWHGQRITTISYAHALSASFKGSCFIVASGPSLADLDLRLISPHHTISLNCAIKKFVDSDMTPTHCVIVDHRVFERNWECVQASVLSGANCFFTFEGLSVICERDPNLLTRGNIYLIESISRKFGIPRLSQAECLEAYGKHPDVWLDSSLPEFCRSIGFSGNLRLGVFSGKTVATWALQLGFGLGYKSIFIVGMDLGGTGKSHFYADQHNPSPDFLRYYRPHIKACFEQARLACDKNGVKVYNLSLNSSLPHEIISKLHFDDALQLAQQ